MNPAALTAALSGDFENARIASTPGGIEAQEAAGQAALVASGAQLPKEMRGVTREQLEAIGFKFGSDIDELFVSVTLPAGWKLKATEHSMHNDLLDANGARRAGIFYKAAFYDRRASINFVPRYYVGGEEPVWLGAFDGEVWRDTEGMQIDVTHWAPMLAGPSGVPERYEPIGRYFMRDGEWIKAAPESPVGETLYRRAHGVPDDGGPVAWMHVQGNHFEPSLRQLDDDEKARGWTEFPLYAAHGVAPCAICESPDLCKQQGCGDAEWKRTHGVKECRECRQTGLTHCQHPNECGGPWTTPAAGVGEVHRG